MYNPSLHTEVVELRLGMLGHAGHADKWPASCTGEGRGLPFIYALRSEGVDSVDVGNMEDGFISRRVGGQFY